MSLTNNIKSSQTKLNLKTVDDYLEFAKVPYEEAEKLGLKKEWEIAKDLEQTAEAKKVVDSAIEGAIYNLDNEYHFDRDNMPEWLHNMLFEDKNSLSKILLCSTYGYPTMEEALVGLIKQHSESNSMATVDYKAAWEPMKKEMPRISNNDSSWFVMNIAKYLNSEFPGMFTGASGSKFPNEHAKELMDILNNFENKVKERFAELDKETGYRLDGFEAEMLQWGLMKTSNTYGGRIMNIYGSIDYEISRLQKDLFAAFKENNYLAGAYDDHNDQYTKFFQLLTQHTLSPVGQGWDTKAAQTRAFDLETFKADVEKHYLECQNFPEKMYISENGFSENSIGKKNEISAPEYVEKYKKFMQFLDKKIAEQKAMQQSTKPKSI